MVSRYFGGYIPNAGFSSSSRSSSADEEEEPPSLQSLGLGGLTFRDYDARSATETDKPSKPSNRDNRSKRSKKGGGVSGWLSDVTGASEWSRTEQAAELRADVQEAQERRAATKGDKSIFADVERLSADFSKFDASARAGMDFLLDNPRASVQDTSRGVLRGAYEKGSGRTLTDEQLVNRYADAAGDVKQAWDESTPDSGALRATGALAEMLVADPVKAGVTGATGIDIDERTTEGTVGAVDAFDIGVTLGTAGAGRFATGAARTAAKSDEAATIFSRLFRRGDEATGASRAAGQTDVTFGARSVDETAGATDETVRQAVRGADETAGAFSRTADDAGSVADDVFRRTDDVTQATEEVAEETAEEAPGLIRRLAASRRAQIGTVGTAGVAAGGLLSQQDQIEVQDPSTGETLVLTKTDNLGESDEHDGGAIWRVERKLTETRTDPDTGESRTVATGSEQVGYTVIVDISGRTVTYLDQNGNARKSRASAETWEAARAAGGRF